MEISRSLRNLNPCNERWRLAQEPSDYEHSSAAFYQFGKQGPVAIKDYQDFLALLLEIEEDERKIQPDVPPPHALKLGGETHLQRKR